MTNRVDTVIKYIENPDKTKERPELSREAIRARKAVGDVISYATNEDKTEQMMYVTGINCNPDTAADDFAVVKGRWHKEGGRLAYHGYQAFKEGEGAITAEQAHDIGVKLAEELWGDRYQVVVATHLNTGHYHNHFVINSVSWVDGKKYVRTKADYWAMRKASDRLCRNAGFHVIDKPSITKGKSYEEWKAEREGRYTIRGRIREDIDYAVMTSMTEAQFIRTMKEMGYSFKFYEEDGKTELKHPGIKPPDAKSYFRFKGLGSDYDLETIKLRIKCKFAPIDTSVLDRKRSYKEWEAPSVDGMTGLQLVYRRYCIRLYSYVSKPRGREYIPMAIREDIAKLDDYIEQLNFLYGSGINDKATADKVLEGYRADLNRLVWKRKDLYARKKWSVDHHRGDVTEACKSEIAETSRMIRELKRKIKLCDRIVVSSDEIMKKAYAPDIKPVDIKPVSINKGNMRNYRR